MQVRCVLVCCILDALMEANKTAADASGGNANAMAAADTSLEDVEVNQAALVRQQQMMQWQQSRQAGQTPEKVFNLL